MVGGDGKNGFDSLIHLGEKIEGSCRREPFPCGEM